MYPGVVVGSVLGADGAGTPPPSFPMRFMHLTHGYIGTVIASATQNDPLINKRVFLTPSRGWDKDPVAPESKY